MISSSIYLGVHGNVFCIDRATGQEIWSTQLKGSSFVNLLVDRDLLIATSHGEAWGLDVATGHILWHNKMEGQGFGLVSIATANSASSAILLEKHRQEEEAAAAASTATTITTV